MENSKFSRYLLYAVGEIILVVIGILIAVNINNWNTESSRIQLEKKVLLELYTNLKMDSADHAGNHEFYMEIVKSNQHIVEQLESRVVWNDSMTVHYGSIFRHGLATLNTSAYENLKSIGFDLITNDSIRNELTTLYGVDYTRLTKFEDELAADNQTNVITPMALKRVRMYSWFRGEPIDYQSLLDDDEFKEVVRWKITAMKFVGGQFQSTLKKSMLLLQSIRHELKKDKYD